MINHYINGEFVSAKSGKTEKLINPATEEVLDEIAWGNADDCSEAIDAASAAFKTWSKTNVYQRANILKKAADIMRANIETFSKEMVMESGKPIAYDDGFTLLDIARKYYCDIGRNPDDLAALCR